MRIRELRAKAREDAQGNKWKLTLPVFLITIFTYLIGEIPNYLPEGIGKIIVGLFIFCATLFVVISGSYAITIRTIKVARKEELNGFFSDMFGEGMRNGFSCAWGIFKKIWYWVVLLIIGYSLIIVSSLSLGSSSLVIDAQMNNNTLLYSILAIVGLLLLFISLIVTIIKSYEYYLITYLKHDYPEKSTSELLDKSKEMMDGNKAKAFVIPLTFIGWLFLAVIAALPVSIIFRMIWPSTVTFGVTTSTMPIWAEILQQIIIYFISSFVSTYLIMTYLEFYFERNPLEIYHEDYIKPETNSSKYKKIVAWICALSLLLTLGMGFIIYYNAAKVTNNALDNLDVLIQQMQEYNDIDYKYEQF